jgi:uncharacterized protein
MDPTPLQIRDIGEARRFYQEVLGCLEDPNKDAGVEFNLYGHQIVCHLNPKLGKQDRVVSHYHLVDGKYVPIAHCEIMLEMKEWNSLIRRLKQRRVKFAIEPYRHLEGAPGVQAALLLLDPSGNALEVQSFCNSAEECLRGERQRVLARWVPLTMLTAFIVCCILLLLKQSEDEMTVRHFSIPAQFLPCAKAKSCTP